MALLMAEMDTLTPVLCSHSSQWRSIAVVSAVDPLARRSELWVNRGRSGSACGGVEIPIRRWVNIIDHRYRNLINKAAPTDMQSTRTVKMAALLISVSFVNITQTLSSASPARCILALAFWATD